MIYFCLFLIVNQRGVFTVKEDTALKRLEKVDRELHRAMDELKRKKPEMSLDEIRELLGKGVISDADPTELIRAMRDRKQLN